MKNGKIIDRDVNSLYYKDDLLHRTDGPSVILNTGDMWWYVNGKCHREDGPAVELANGLKSWYLNNIEYSEEDYKVAVRKFKLQRIKELLK